MRPENAARLDRHNLQGRLDALATRLSALRTRMNGGGVPSRAAAVAAANDMALQRGLAVRDLRASGGLDDKASAEILEAVAVLLDDLEESMTDEEAIRITTSR